VWQATSPGKGPGVQKTPVAGGDGFLAVASAGRDADGVVGAAGTARHVGSSSMGGQRKVTALGGPGGRPWRQGSAGGGEVQAGLERAGGDGVSPVADLDAEPVPAAGQHAVGAVIERLQRWHMAVLAYKDCKGSSRSASSSSGTYQAHALLCLVATIRQHPIHLKIY
jgi:hypothetical protein